MFDSRKITRLRFFMKRLNKKWMALMLAGACVVTAGAATVGVITTAAEDAKTYEISKIFSTDGGVIDSGELGGKQTVKFVLGNKDTVTYAKNLALQWFTAANEPKYLTMAFAIENLNDGDSVTFAIESASSVATEEDKVTNSLKFKKVGTDLQVTAINASNEKDEESARTYKTVTDAANIQVALSAGSKFDAYDVTVGGQVFEDGFTNIGASYAKYEYEEMMPLTISASMANDEALSTVYLTEINGQRFDNVADKKVTDTAAPVLVVNEDVAGFQFGTTYALSYEKIDVLESSLTEDKEYYQYNPADSEASYVDIPGTLYLMDTVYYENGSGEKSKTKKDGYTAKSVMTVENAEYISLKYKLKDKANDEVVYDIAWYAESNAVTTKGETSYIVIDKNEDGPTYKYIALDDDNDKNVYTDEPAFLAKKNAYQDEVTKAAADEDALPGSGSSIKLPSVEWLLGDNGGYRAMKFTISYKTPSSSTAKSASGLSYSSLKITTSESGAYAFKIFATDKAGNPMKYYVDGQLTELTADNVWEIDEIPEFSFEIADCAVQIKDAKTNTAKDKVVEKILDQTYTLSGLKVVGAENEQSDYKLFRIDHTGYNGPAITEEALSGVRYETLRAKVDEALAAGKVVDGTYKSYFDLYLDIYAEQIAVEINGDKAAIKGCFKEIQEYNARITEEDAEWEEYNKYNWNPTSKSFKTAEEGEYVIFADFWDKETPAQRATAYKVVLVESEADIIEGESKTTNWIKNNIVSVILFGVAGLMLIAIIVLLLVKPSDETLEEVEAKDEEKKAKKEAKKAKKEENKDEE